LLKRHGDAVGYNVLSIGVVLGLTIANVEHLWIEQSIYLGCVVSGPWARWSNALLTAEGFNVKANQSHQYICQLRVSHREMTQAELADKIGFIRQTIIATGQGRYSPSLEMAFQITRVFKVPLQGDLSHN
jgi:putative transcriptional regulator